MNNLEDNFALMAKYSGSEREWSTRVESVDEGYIALHEIICPSFAEENAGINGISLDDYDLWERDNDGKFYIWEGESDQTFKEYCAARDLENRFAQIDHVYELECEHDDFDQDDIYG